MNRSLTARIMDLLQRRQLKGTLAKIALTLSCVAIFMITYMLVAPVLTQEWEPTCGLEEHTHTDECYSLIPADELGHKHTDECYSLVPAEGTGGHQHTEECYTWVPEEEAEGEDGAGHQHTDECYSLVPVEGTGHQHTEACYTLAPAEGAEPGHQHSDACYEEVQGELICEAEEHTHGETCRDEEGDLTCGLEEHSHNEKCYTVEKQLICGLEETAAGEPEAEKVLTCGQEETAPEMEKALTCGMEEADPEGEPAAEAAPEGNVPEEAGPEGEPAAEAAPEGNVPEEADPEGEPAAEAAPEGNVPEEVGPEEDSLEEDTPEAAAPEATAPKGEAEEDGQGPKMKKVLTCGLEETEEPEMERVLSCGMKETEDAQVLGTEEGQDGQEMVRVLTCELEEHEHDDQCYYREGEGEPKYICGFQTEHTHSENCYFENGELKCNIPEHVHSESCLDEKPGQAEGPIFPDELPEGYMEAEVWTEDETASLFGQEEDNGEEAEGLKAQVYVPKDAFEEEAVFVPQKIDEGEDAYDKVVNELAEAGAEYDSMTAMDLSFWGSSGDEPLEPNTENGPVYVRLTMPVELPEAAEPLDETEPAEGEEKEEYVPEFSLWHHTENGAEEVRSYAVYEDGVLTVEFKTDSFSMYSVNTKTNSIETGVKWGQPSETDVPAGDSQNAIWTWNVARTLHRYVNVPVCINVSGDALIELPYYVKDAKRTIGELSTLDPVYQDKKVNDATSIERIEKPEENKLIIKNHGKHGSIKVYYNFDCWNIPSDTPFNIECTIRKGLEENQGQTTTYKLTGQFHTEHGVQIGEYANAVGNSEYAFDGFGGVDKKSAYIQHWDATYEKYFDLKEEVYNADKDKYVYDIAAFLVRPTGQQPYDISGTFTPDQGGEVVGGVYMMDSHNDPDALCVKITGNSFSISSKDSLLVDALDENGNKINGKKTLAVVSNLSEATDSKTYTLYFLVKYPRASLQDAGKDENENRLIRLKAGLTLTHTGIDSEELVSASQTAVLYEGKENPGERIYWASFVSNRVASAAGMSTLKNENKEATLNFSADFFCLNKQRNGGSTSEGKYELNAIIDLSYLTNAGNTAHRLKEGDYSLTAFNLSLIDADGNWSQNTQEVPNVGWTQDKFGVPSEERDNIQVYGSRSMTDQTDWTLLATIPAAEVWAQDEERGFPKSNAWTIDTQDVVRLKVVYNSQNTTALRVGYTMKLKPSIVSKYSLNGLTSLDMTSWLNYVAYKDGKKDLGQGFYRTTVTDSTMGLARDYDEAYPCAGYGGLVLQPDGSELEGYSMRNCAYATLGTGSEVAGMIVTQTLYDSSGTALGYTGNKEESDDGYQVDGGLKTDISYSQERTVINASEIVYTISGVVTNGASPGELNGHRSDASADSPYKSVKQRYYVLLDKGLKLNMDPGPIAEHWSTFGDSENYLSTTSAFYNSLSPKRVQKGTEVAAVSEVSVPTWEKYSKNGKDFLAAVYWPYEGSAEWMQTYELEDGRQLVVFDRTIANEEGESEYDKWTWDHNGTKRCYWGRGLSFSVIPTGPVGSLTHKDGFKTEFWCQYLDETDRPFSMEEFTRNQNGLGSIEKLEEAVGNIDKNTLLYVPITFNNRAGNGVSSAELHVRNNTSEDAETPYQPSNEGNDAPPYGTEADVKPEEHYSYKLHYEVSGGSAKDVVLWCNIEDYNRNGRTSEWYGTVEGVDLNGRNDVEVYVKFDRFNIQNYLSSTSNETTTTGAQANWLKDSNSVDGWTKVTNPASYTQWRDVKAVAFKFTSDFTDGKDAAVYIKMKAPIEEPLTIGGMPKEVGKTTYVTYNEFIFTDNHSSTNQGTSEDIGRVLVAATQVTIPVTPVTYVLPSTGGPGTATIYATGTAFLTSAAYLMYQALRRSRVTGEPAAQPRNRKGGTA